MKRIFQRITVGVVAMLLISSGTASADVVLHWNAIMLNTIGAENPFAQTRIAAITHTAVFEAVNTHLGKVVYDPAKVSYEDLLKAFWESHDPTQGMRQGNDIGTQYRSAIYYTTDAQKRAAEAGRQRFQEALTRAHRSAITTEILEAPDFYYAEEYHQQYLAKNPDGYCGLSGCGVTYATA